MKKTVNKRLTAWVIVVVAISMALFGTLVVHNRRANEITSSQLGTIYMSEMMYQMQDHFTTIIEMKHQEVQHIAEHTNYVEDNHYRESLSNAAKGLEFEYLALYDASGNYDILLGEVAWYRDLNDYISRIMSGELAVTTGYLTSTGNKYIVFGVPAEYVMESGEKSQVLLAGFSVEKLYDYIDLEELQELGSNATVEIILTNGAYVLKNTNDTESSFFDYVDKIGGFVDMDIEEGIDSIETAMSSQESFTNFITVNGTLQHIYGAPAMEPSNWYFVISMAQGVSDDVIHRQNVMVTHAYLVAGLIVMLMFYGVFISYRKTSSKQMQEIENARADAETASKAKSTFLSNMSHDIRTPMNAIVGFTSIIERSIRDKDYDKAQETLVKMKHSSDYLRNLISDVLDMSKIESGMLTLMPESVSIKRVSNTVITITNEHTQSNHQIFEVDMHDMMHDQVSCDATRLNQILINLLGNAIKFTPKGGKIEFEVWQEKSKMGDEYVHTCFVIKDNGIGMSENFLQNMFESFAREESKVRKIEGTGLGLTITKSLLDMMNGTIEVESTEGKGSRFFVAIDFPKAELPSEENVLPDSFDAKGMRILLAEDNEFNYDIARELLTANGFLVEWAENGREAVDKYCENPADCDLILMDLRMPVLDGYQATEKIRQYEENKNLEKRVPILALSADVFAEDIEHCRQVGMEGHIAKPIDIQELLHALSKYC